MSAQPSFHIKPLSASDALDCFVALAEDLYPKVPFSLNVQANVSGVGAEFSKQAAAGLSAAKDVTDFRARLAQLPPLMASAVVLTVPTANQGPVLRYTLSSDRLTGDIAITAKGEDLDRVLKALHQHLNVSSYKDVIAAQMSDAERTALQLRERAAADLQTQVEKLAAFVADMTRRETEARRTLQAELEKDYRERVAKAEQLHLERQAAADEREKQAFAVLDQQRQEHLAEVARFENRDAKVMRRHLLDRIEQLLDKTKDPSLSDATEDKRKIVHGFTWLLMALSAALVATYTLLLLMQVQNKSPIDWHLLLPLAAGSTTLVATFLYYLKWNDRWFREHADAEFSARAFQRDVLRASWVAELVSEWAKENEGRDLPDELLEAFTRNLFRDSGPTRENEHPYEHLTSIMKRATEFTLGKNLLSVKGPAERAPAERAQRSQHPTSGDGS